MSVNLSRNTSVHYIYCEYCGDHVLASALAKCTVCGDICCQSCGIECAECGEITCSSCKSELEPTVCYQCEDVHISNKMIENGLGDSDPLKDFQELFAEAFLYVDGVSYRLSDRENSRMLFIELMNQTKLSSFYDHTDILFDIKGIGRVKYTHSLRRPNVAGNRYDIYCRKLAGL
ncbi:hypothetical protein D3C72_1305190 [compost metagenome]